MDNVEKTCVNCRYENESQLGEHCLHCIHNATDNFKQKLVFTKEEMIVRNQTIEEILEILRKYEVPMDYNANYEILNLKC